MDFNDLNKLTPEQFAELKRKMDEAENDTTPFVIVDDQDGDKIKVFGDVSKTEVKKFDYKVQFYYRNTPENRQALEGKTIIGQTPNYIGVEEEYHDAWIPPRRFTAVQSTAMQLYKFFNIVTEKGELRDLTNDEMIVALNTMSPQMIDAMCDVVCEVLNIPMSRSEDMLPLSAIEAVKQMVEQFPEVMNGVDFTTDELSERN